jgi:hypothetical protein
MPHFRIEKRPEEAHLLGLAGSCWPEGNSKPTDEFVPFAFEIGGALGTEAEDFTREVVKVAQFCRRGHRPTTNCEN